MAKSTEVILRAEVEDLGHAGDLVEVAPGYARNYLLPRGLAYVATESNKHRVAQEKEKYEAKLEKERAVAEVLAGRLEGLILEFRENAGEEDQLYGSVSLADIADRLEALGFEIERSQIKLDQPIKSLGEFEVPLRLHPRVTQSISVRVEREEG
ncbi:MAG TPA: 50S ribosomal protein L9 [Gemmatimonadota bacterium]|nr:50S ribosomal protein L9 [Gemmatimonadota bacterium]